MFVGHLYVFFGEVSIFHPFLIGLFVFLILSYMSNLYILKINPLSVASFPNIFSYSEACPFILFMVSFAVPKLAVIYVSDCFAYIFLYSFLPYS